MNTDKNWKKRDRTARLLRLQLLLWQNPDGVEVKELARRCGVSERTVYRDLAALDAELGVPVWEQGSRRGISEGYFLPPVSFSSSEAVHVFLVARMMQNYFHLYNPSIVSTFMKLNTVVPQPLRQQIRHLIGHMETLPHSERKISNINTCIDAWLTRHRLRVVYQELADQAPVVLTVEPYFIDLGAPGFSYYLIGNCRPAGDVRSLKMDRIAGKVAILPETFELPDDFDFIDYLGSAWGANIDGTVQTMKLRFSKKNSKAVRETIWHPSQNIEMLPDGRLDMTFKVRNTLDFRNWVLGWGSGVEVIEPESLRREVLGISHDIIDAYTREGELKSSRDVPPRRKR